MSGRGGLRSYSNSALTSARSAGVKGGRRESVAPIDLVSRIQKVEGDLSAAERRVAAAVAAEYDATTRMTIGDLAKRAGVNQPSVTRFCRSVGCGSFGEFKVRLATTLTVAAVYLKTDRVFDDDVGQLAQVVMLRASSAIRDCLEWLDTSAVRRAIAAIAGGARLDIYGQGGGSASLAEDAKLQFFRLGIPVCAYADGHQQRMSASTLKPKDVAYLEQRPLARRDRRDRDRSLLWGDNCRANAAKDPARRGRGSGHSPRHSRRRQRFDAYGLSLRPHGGD